MNIPQSPWRLTLTYALAAGLWVFFSDRLLATLGLPLAQLERAQLLKGLGFVLLTAGLLYAVLRTHRQQHNQVNLALSSSKQR
ncbi:MAG: GGDEF domain-containing protein, partial [Pseudomonadales bacterium]